MMTYSDDYCTDTMNYQVLVGGEYKDSTPIFERGNDDTPTIQRWLSLKDRELLIGYAPKLFNTLPSQYDLHDTMLGLVEAIAIHRFEVLWQRQEKERLSQYSMSNRSADNKVEALKKHIQAIVGIIGQEECSIDKYRTPLDDLIRELKKAYENPLPYLPRGWTPAYDEDLNMTPLHTKRPISDYLNVLDLPDKTNVIRNFMKELNSQDWFSTFMVKKQVIPPPYSS